MKAQTKFAAGRGSLVILLIPLVIYLLAFYLYPLLYSFYLGFFQWSLGDPTKVFVGLQNYVRAIFDSQFRIAFINTLVFVAGAVSIELILGLSIALLLNKETKIMEMLRTVVLLPTVLTPLVVALTWKALLHPDLGVITYYLRALGINIGRGLTVERSTAMFSLILVDVWQWTSLMAIILLAGLKGLPREPYEAAIVDGASGWQLLRYITLPLLRPTLLVALVIRGMDALKIFDSVFAITHGGPGTATTTMNFHIFKVGIEQLQIGYASALSNFFLVFSVVVGVIVVHFLYFKKGGIG